MKKNALSGTKLPMTQKQYGASMGGPISRDRTFYFANAEQRRLDQTGLTTISSDNVGDINARLLAARYPGSLISTGIYPNPVDTTNVLAKLDHQFSTRDQFTIRYSLYDVASQNSRGAGALNAADGIGRPRQSRSVAGVRQHADAVVADGQRNARSDHAQRLEGASERSDRACSQHRRRGVVRHAPREARRPAGTRMFQAVSNVSHQAGAHAIRAGVDFIYNDDTITYPRSVRGAYTFSSLENFLAGTYNPSGFTQTFGDSIVSQTNPNVGVYVQDEWKAHPSLTVNAGLRYDIQFLRNDQHRHRQRFTACWVLRGRRRDSAASDRPRKCRPVFRSRAASGGGQCAAVCRQHDRSERAATNKHQLVAYSSGSAGVSRTFWPPRCPRSPSST